jgi:hypothetical protein
LSLYGKAALRRRQHRHRAGWEAAHGERRLPSDGTCDMDAVLGGALKKEGGDDDRSIRGSHHVDWGVTSAMGNAGTMENRRVAVARCVGGLALGTKRRPEKALDPERERER